MEAKDYTNIAGSPFQPYVAKQIEERKKIISKENRTPRELLWLNNKNVWVRISSGTDVDNDNEHFKNETGSILSKKYLLQAGLTDHTRDENSYKLRSGIGSDRAYGLGGVDFGFKPMPGLENITIKTGGKLGTLREATFEFTCYNLEQLYIMEALYMKLGFSVLIEWGHIPYLNNEGGLEVNPKPLNFYKINSKEELMKAIQNKRVEHFGNYDAMWGTVKNFSYSFENNGEFKCKVDLVGAGDVLESLKINQSGNSSNPPISESDDYPVVADANKSLLNEALYNYYDLAKNESNNPSIFKGVLTNYFKKLNINFEDFSQNDDLIQKGFHYSLLSDLNKNNGGSPINIPNIINYNLYFSQFKLDIEINSEEGEEKPETQVYITLGHLLLLILATGGIYDKIETKENPYIYIDINPETNRCYTFSGHCSLDPTVCLIGSEGLPFSIQSDVFLNQIKPSYPFYDVDNPTLGGRFMWTLVNIDFIVKTLRKYSSSDPKQKVNFVDFVQDILKGISKACGGFNEFRLVPDDDSRCVRIFDDRVMPNYKFETSRYTEIPVLGKNSLVYNFNYTSKISPQLATEIVIAAQAQNKEILGSKDALAFSHLNKGLTNRLSPTRVESVTELNQNATLNKTLNKYIELRNFINDIYSGTLTVGLMDEKTLQAVNQENKARVENGYLIVPEDKRKDVALAYIERVYSEMLKRAEKSKQVGNELKNLNESYNELMEDINDGSDTDIIDSFLKTNNEKEYTVPLPTLYYEIHTKLEKNYKSKNYIKDTPMEAIWTSLAKEQTNSDRSWY